jgi:hypothetical protein
MSDGAFNTGKEIEEINVKRFIAPHVQLWISPILGQNMDEFCDGVHEDSDKLPQMLRQARSITAGLSKYMYCRQCWALTD